MVYYDWKSELPEEILLDVCVKSVMEEAERVPPPVKRICCTSVWLTIRISQSFLVTVFLEYFYTHFMV